MLCLAWLQMPGFRAKTPSSTTSEIYGDTGTSPSNCMKLDPSQ